MLSLAIFIAALWYSGSEACTGLHGVPSIPIPSVPGGGGSHGGGSKGKGCLPLDAEILMADGHDTQKAGDLVIGDYVWGDNGTTPVVLTPTLDKEKVYRFIEFKTKRGYGTALTPHHALFTRPCGLDRDQPWPIKRADDLAVNECVPTIDGQEDVVVSMNLLELKGKIHVITASGKLASGGVILSCYDHEEKSSQEQVHAPFEPVRIMYDWAETIYNGLSNEQYAQGVLRTLVKSLGLERLHSQ